jgi:hypothetical protein
MATVNRQWTVGRPSADPGGLCLTRAHFVAAEGEVPAPEVAISQFAGGVNGRKLIHIAGSPAN